MRTLFLSMALAVALGGCATNGEPSIKDIAAADTGCASDVRGRTTTKLKYGKDDIDIKWKSKVGFGSEFRIHLKPDKGYQNKLVEIIGRRGTLPPDAGGGNTSFAWLNIAKSYNDLKAEKKGPYLILCVPAEVPVGTEYKFDVRIESIGRIDPRADVTY